MIGLLKILQLKYLLLAAVYSGTVYVITNETKVIILESAAKAKQEYKNYNDSLALAMQESYRAEVEKYPKVISMDDITESFRIISNDNQRSFKKYADKENKIQEKFYVKFFEKLLNNAYFQDKHGATWKVFYYMQNDSAIVFRKKPVTQSEYDNLGK